jgi:hypothetical protein
MAKRITAIRAYRPEIERERTLQTAQIVEDIAQGTSLNEGSIRFVVYELRDAILKAHRQQRVDLRVRFGDDDQL